MNFTSTVNVDALVSISLSDPIRENTWWVSLKLAYSRTKMYYINYTSSHQIPAGTKQPI